jgi:hypothetical protein
MRLADVADSIVIDPRKLTEYALDPESPWGRHKARRFKEKLGFTKENYQLLMEQIMEKALDGEAFLHREDRFGKRYTVDLRIRGVEGQEAIVRTGWLIPHGSREAKLLTLYVRKVSQTERSK